MSLGLGIGAAIFLSEYAPEKVRRVLKPVLEVLAGIPTVVYGYFALLLVTPFLRSIVGTENLPVFNALSAGLVMGIMIMPMVTTLSEDAMTAVPRSLRDAAYALGATRFEVATKVVVPAGIVGHSSVVHPRPFASGRGDDDCVPRRRWQAELNFQPA